jgi:uncharacterized protein YprB with RNaseH-like and TPR domain
VLTRSFIHIPGVGPRTEQRLWQQGLTDWQQALAWGGPVEGFSPSRWRQACDRLRNSMDCLHAGDHRFFATALPPVEHWRAWPDFRRRTAFVDIETSGMGPWAQITVIGVYDGNRTATYVAGDNLEQFAYDLERFSMLVTFNGTCFDLPYLRRAFPQASWDQLHCDLRFALRRLGYRGGLKAIEQRLGVARADEVEGLSGEDAVRLWYEYLAGNEDSLSRLVQYNAADVENLQLLMDFAYDRLFARLMEGILA